MALDQAYFDAISIDTVKKKYYNAGKVEAVLEDIRRQALALTEENERLRSQLGALSGQKDEIGDTLLSAKTIAQQILHDAEGKAQAVLAEAEESRRQIVAAAEEEGRRITAEAEQRRRALTEENETLERELPQRLEEVEHRLRRSIMNCLEDVSEELSALSAGVKAAAAPEIVPEEAPVDAALDEKLEAIARDIFSLDELLGDTPAGEDEP